ARAPIICVEGVVSRNPERPVSPGVVFRSSRAVLELITRSDGLLAATAGMNTSCARGDDATLIPNLGALPLDWVCLFRPTKLEQDNGTGRIEVAEHRCR